jgi:hypothetical protein
MQMNKNFTEAMEDSVNSIKANEKEVLFGRDSKESRGFYSQRHRKYIILRETIEDFTKRSLFSLVLVDDTKPEKTGVIRLELEATPPPSHPKDFNWSKVHFELNRSESLLLLQVGANVYGRHRTIFLMFTDGCSWDLQPAR